MGIEKTIRVLRKSESPTAANLLMTATRSASGPLREGAVLALAESREQEIHDQLILSFSDLHTDARNVLSQIPNNSPLRKGLSRQILSQSPQLALAACHFTVAAGATEHIPAVVSEALRLAPSLAKPFVQITLELTRKLAADMLRSERGEAINYEPAFVRRVAVQSLGSTLANYIEHRHAELVESLLLIAPYDHPELTKAIHDVRHAAHEVIRSILQKNEEEGVARILAGIISDMKAPDALLQIASVRTEPFVLKQILSSLGSPLGSRAKQNVLRLDGFAWASPDKLDSLSALDAEQIGVAFDLAASTQMGRGTLAKFIVASFSSDNDAVRAAACGALTLLPTSMATEAIIGALDDPSPLVVCKAVDLVRIRKLPVNFQKWVALLDFPDEAVRQSVRASMKAIKFPAYREIFETLSPGRKRWLGELVAKADPSSLDTLERELSSGAVDRRLRALEYIEAMGVTVWFIDQMISRLADNDAAVRAESVRVLGGTKPTAPLIAVISVLREDPSNSVREAVEKALEKLMSADPALAERLRDRMPV